MSRKIRHTLSQVKMYDINKKNAHPTLLSSFCHKNGIECSGLDNYINHGEEYLADLMRCRRLSRDEAKLQLLAILNGRKKKLEPEHPEWFESYYNGMRHKMTALIEL